MPPGSIPHDDEQKGTGFFVGGMALHHFQDGPVTPRSSMLKTTAIEGHWSGETIVDLAMKVRCCFVAFAVLLPNDRCTLMGVALACVSENCETSGISGRSVRPH